MKSIELLITNLRNEYWKTRVNAAYELGEIGDPVAVFPLIEALRDEERLVKESAVEALGKIGNQAVIPLIGALSDEDWVIKSAAESALVKIGKPTVKPLVKLLKNRNESFWESASGILGKIGDSEAALPLINALEEENVIILNYAISTLGRIGDKRAIQPIINVTKKYGNTFDSTKALVNLGEPVTKPLLLDLLRSEDCWRTAELLGSFGKTAVEPLVALLKDKEINQQGLVAAALGYTGAKEAVNPLIAALQDENRIVSWRASKALVEIGKVAVEPLIKMLNHKNDYLRMLAIDSLGKIEDKRAIEPLKKLINNNNSVELRQLALKALERIQPKEVTPYTDIEKKIDIEKDVFVLKLGLMDRFFRAELANDMLYLSTSDILNLKKGELNPPVPVPYRYAGGKTIPEDFIWTATSGFIISDRIRELFVSCNFTGWKTYPISLYGKGGNLIDGYHGFAVTGRVGEIDFSRSKIVSIPPIVVGKPNIVKMGIYFDESSWDGNDFFFTMGISVTGRVVEALQKLTPKVKNWEAIIASKYEFSIDLFEPELTEKERDKVNELRRAFRKEHQQELKRTTEILVHGEIGDNQELLYLLKSIVQNQCMFTTISDQSICQGILKSLDETGQPGIVQLIDALKNKDGEIRAGAAWALGNLKVRNAVVPLMQAIRDGDEYVRREAVMALGEIRDSRAVMPLIEVLEGEDTIYVRCGAAEALGAIGDAKAVQPLISILKNEEEVFVLSEAVLALGKFGEPKAVLPLIELFENEDSNLAEHIKWALVDIGQPAVISLIQSLNHNHPLVRQRAARTLGEMHEQNALLPLIDRLAFEKDPEVLSFIVEALGQLGDRRAVKPLLNIIQTTTTEYLQEEIRIALQKIQG